MCLTRCSPFPWNFVKFLNADPLQPAEAQIQAGDAKIVQGNRDDKPIVFDRALHGRQNLDLVPALTWVLPWPGTRLDFTGTGPVNTAARFQFGPHSAKAQLKVKGEFGQSAKLLGPEVGPSDVNVIYNVEIPASYFVTTGGVTQFYAFACGWEEGEGPTDGPLVEVFTYKNNHPPQLTVSETDLEMTPGTSQVIHFTIIDVDEEVRWLGFKMDGGLSHSTWYQPTWHEMGGPETWTWSVADFWKWGPAYTTKGTHTLVMWAHDGIIASAEHQITLRLTDTRPLTPEIWLSAGWDFITIPLVAPPPTNIVIQNLTIGPHISDAKVNLQWDTTSSEIYHAATGTGIKDEKVNLPVTFPSTLTRVPGVYPLKYVASGDPVAAASPAVSFAKYRVNARPVLTVSTRGLDPEFVSRVVELTITDPDALPAAEHPQTLRLYSKVDALGSAYGKAWYDTGVTIAPGDTSVELPWNTFDCYWQGCYTMRLKLTDGFEESGECQLLFAIVPELDWTFDTIDGLEIAQSELGAQEISVTTNVPLKVEWKVDSGSFHETTLEGPLADAQILTSSFGTEWSDLAAGDHVLTLRCGSASLSQTITVVPALLAWAWTGGGTPQIRAVDFARTTRTLEITQAEGVAGAVLEWAIDQTTTWLQPSYLGLAGPRLLRTIVASESPVPASYSTLGIHTLHIRFDGVIVSHNYEITNPAPPVVEWAWQRNPATMIVDPRWRLPLRLVLSTSGADQWDPIRWTTDAVPNPFDQWTSFAGISPPVSGELIRVDELQYFDTSVGEHTLRIGIWDVVASHTYTILGVESGMHLVVLSEVVSVPGSELATTSAGVQVKTTGLTSSGSGLLRIGSTSLTNTSIVIPFPAENFSIPIAQLQSYLGPAQKVAGGCDIYISVIDPATTMTTDGTPSFRLFVTDEVVAPSGSSTATSDGGSSVTSDVGGSSAMTNNDGGSSSSDGGKGSGGSRSGGGSSGKKTTTTIAISVGVVVGVGLLAGAAFLVWRWRAGKAVEQDGPLVTEDGNQVGEAGPRDPEPEELDDSADQWHV
jgi:uncharacterized membrane protein YgcG